MDFFDSFKFRLKLNRHKADPVDVVGAVSCRHLALLTSTSPSVAVWADLPAARPLNFPRLQLFTLYFPYN